MRAIVRERILSKCNNECVQCGTKERLEVDHIIPLSIGGRDDEDNMQILCRTCNAKKHNKNIYYGVIKIDKHYKDYVFVNRELGLQIITSGKKQGLLFTNHLREVLAHTEKYIPVYGVPDIVDKEEGGNEVV